MKIRSGVWYCVKDNVIQIVEPVILIDGVPGFYAIETSENCYYYLDEGTSFVDSMIYLGEL